MTSEARTATARVRVGGRWTVGEVTTTWSVSDGSRGRRWRATSAIGGSVLSYALETDRDGRFVKIEAVTADALLTLHREADGSLHGHVVRPAGIDHLALGTLPTPVILLEGEVLAAAALVAGLRELGTWARATDPVRLPVVRIARSLEVAIVEASIERADGDRFRIAGPGVAALEVVVGDGGLPVVPGAPGWPLER